MEHSAQVFEVAESGQLAGPKEPSACPVLGEFASLAGSVVPNAEELAHRSSIEPTLALEWRRLALLVDYVVRICLPYIFRECGRTDSAHYLANLPQFGLGSQLGLYYRALIRSAEGAYNRYLEPLLSKIVALAGLLRKDSLSKPIPAGVVSNLWQFIEIRGVERDIRCLLKRVAGLGALPATA